MARLASRAWLRCATRRCGSTWLYQLKKRPAKLVVAALCRSHNLPVEGGYPTAKVTFEWARKALPTIVGYFIEHLDGFRTSVFMTGIRDFNYAGWLGKEGKILTCRCTCRCRGMVPQQPTSLTHSFVTPKR